MSTKQKQSTSSKIESNRKAKIENDGLIAIIETSEAKSKRAKSKGEFEKSFDTFDEQRTKMRREQVELIKKKLPKGEKVWVSKFHENSVLYELVTSNLHRTVWTSWSINGSAVAKKKVGDSPLDI